MGRSWPIYDAAGVRIGIACARGGRSHRCKECGAAAGKQCDFPLSGKRAGKTCDAYLCDRCAKNVGPDRDYCPPHWRADQKRQLTLGALDDVADVEAAARKEPV